MLRSISREDMFHMFDALGGAVPDANQYQEFCTLYLQHPLSVEMAQTDPFSPQYAKLAMDLYFDLRGRADGYDPQRDEDSGLRAVPDVWKDIVPWSFKDTKLVSEFLTSWGQIIRCLDLEPGSNASIIEYGTGSGQLLLMLARLGLHTHAVDIDEGSLALVKAQSDLMGLSVQTERATFGEGFLDKKFDRVIFFEAFHHAADFLTLLSRMQDRIKFGGRLIFCGEPVVGENMAAVPYPWGPRLDALSVFCIRKWGWMELGFSHSFFVAALQRKGWMLEMRPSGDCARANAMVARSLFHESVALGGPVELGSFTSGWQVGENTHRWTCGGRSFFPLSDNTEPKNIRVRMYNPLPVPQSVIVRVGTTSSETLVPAGTENVDVVLENVFGELLEITCDPIQPSVIMGNGDTRMLGIAVREIDVSLRSKT